METMAMFSRLTVNIFAMSLLTLFLVQSGYDIVSPAYEVPAGMYGIITIVVGAVVGTAVGISIVKHKNGKNGEGNGEG